MNDSVKLFQKDKDLLDKWIAIAVTDDFKRVIAYARASILESEGINSDVMKGVNLLATTLVTMVEADEALPPNVSTGLVHDLQVKRTVKKSEKKD